MTSIFSPHSQQYPVIAKESSQIGELKEDRYALMEF